MGPDLGFYRNKYHFYSLNEPFAKVGVYWSVLACKFSDKSKGCNCLFALNEKIVVLLKIGNDQTKRRVGLILGFCVNLESVCAPVPTSLEWFLLSEKEVDHLG